MCCYLQTEFVKSASEHDLRQLGLASASRPSLGADLELLPIEQRLQCVQVSFALAWLQAICKRCQSYSHSAADESVALVRHGINKLQPVQCHLHVL